MTNDIETVRAADILGRRYSDTITGYEGTATAVYHFLHGCTRVRVDTLDHEGNPTDHVFDFPQLRELEAPRHKPAGDVPG